MTREPDRQLPCRTCTLKAGKPTVTTHTVFFSRSAAGHVLLRICRCVECATLNENCGAP